jgi:hypothetical protein
MNLLNSTGPRASMSETETTAKPKQLLHLVFGGELESMTASEFKDLDKLARGMEGKGARHRRQRRDTVFHRSSAPAARSD